MQSVSRRKAFIKLKGGKRPQRKLPAPPVDNGNDDEPLVGEAAKTSVPVFPARLPAPSTKPPARQSRSTAAYVVLWSGVAMLLSGMIWTALHDSGRPVVEVNVRATPGNPPRRQIGGDVVGDRVASARTAGNESAALDGVGSLGGVGGVPTTEGFLAAPLVRQSNSGNQRSQLADARHTALKPGDFRRTTCAVQTGDLATLSAEKLTQCIEDARVR